MTFPFFIVNNTCEPIAKCFHRHKKVQSGVEWTKNSDIPRFPASSGQRVNEEGSIVPSERLLELQDVDPGM